MQLSRSVIFEINKRTKNIFSTKLLQRLLLQKTTLKAKVGKVKSLSEYRFFFIGRLAAPNSTWDH